MRVLNDFTCDHCGHTEEHFRENEVKTVDCLECGGIARKVRSIPKFMLPGNDPAGFPTAADKWVKNREQKIAQEKKLARN